MRDNDRDRVAWVTGAGSGMGRASALALAAEGFAIALSGRRRSALTAVRDQILENGGVAAAFPFDVTDTVSVDTCAQEISTELGPISDLILSAGLNTPHRYWRDQTIATFEGIVSTNLVGAANVTQAALPGMRSRGSGTVVFISSYSGWRFSPDAGVAYSASKTALSTLAETLNAQENVNGIRACNLCPGDVDSDFLDMRPSVPDEDARRQMLSPEDVAAAVRFVATSPTNVCVNELVITPVKSRAMTVEA